MNIKKTILFLLISFLLFSLGCVEERSYQTSETPMPSSAVVDALTHTLTVTPPSATAIFTTPTSTPPSVVPTGTESKITPAITLPNDSLNLSAHFIDVGQGDSILIKFAGKNILVDGGERDMGSRVSSYLRNQGISEIDLMVATHPHSDHIGGLITILNDFKVKQVLDSGQVHTSQTYETFLTLIDQKNIPYKVAEKGQTIDFDPSINIQILSPPPPASRLKDLNENSIILKITYNQVIFLLMGDAGFEAENLISSDDLDSDVLKVGHHGSKYAAGSTFLGKVTPVICVVQLGEGNPYGHPAPETISRLQNIGTKIYRTDTHGNIVITTDGRGYSVTTQKQPVQAVTTGTVTPAPTPTQNPIVATTTSTPDLASVYISAIQFDAPGDDQKNLNGEWVKITNSDSGAVVITGWKLSDEGDKHEYIFPSFTLSSGNTVTIFTGSGSNTATELYMGYGVPIWNNDGDTATLRDGSGNIINQKSG